jgi:uncharacterized protein (TIGR01777 family)
MESTISPARHTITGMSRTVVTGATGLIGRELVAALLERGDEVRALTRDPARARSLLGDRVEPFGWPEPTDAPPPAAALAGADRVVSLLGEPVAQRWSADAKRRIRDSRVLGTRNLVAGLAALPDGERPEVLLSGSAVGYYGPRGAEPLDESAPPGSDFLADLAAAWEAEAVAAGELGLRVVLTRTGLALSRDGGALQQMLPPFRLGVGGPLADGRQYVPWVHLTDVVEALVTVLDDRRASGPVNTTAPYPVTNREFSRTLGRVLRRPAVLPVPTLALKLRFGELGEMVATGQRAVPAALSALGYRFRWPELEPALRDVIG